MTDFALPRHDARTLIIMRHAEADWGLDDFNRPLTRRGSEQARRAGQWLKQEGLVPEMLVSSAALRTRQTTTWVSDALGEKAPTASLDERLYNAPASALLTAINRTPSGVQSLMLIAHLPGVQDAALQLARPDSDYEALMDASYGYAPSSLTVFQVVGDWDQLVEGEARLTHFATFGE
ncbi:SixA phosphatase family protein [Rothia sp. 88186D007BW]